jgi:hypothetical protein
MCLVFRFLTQRVNCGRDHDLTSALSTISNLMEKKQKKNLAGSKRIC